MKLLALMIVLAASVSLAGCVTTSSGPACDGWRQIKPDARDIEIMSRSLAEQILSHDEHGEKTCGWKP